MIPLDYSCLSAGIILDCDSLSTWIQFGLAILGVILSCFAIRATCKVHKEVALQQFKIKQQEEVAKLVAQINKYSFNLNFLYSDGPEYPQYYNVNFGGVIQINNTLKEKYPEFLERKIGISDALLFEPFEELSMSAYLPASIAVQLNPFCRNIWDEDNLTKESKIIVYVLIDKTGEDPNREDKSYSIPANTFPDWKTFVNKVDLLLKSVKVWYSKENNNIEPNIISHFQERTYFN